MATRKAHDRGMKDFTRVESACLLDLLTDEASVLVLAECDALSPAQASNLLGRLRRVVRAHTNYPRKKA